MKNLKNSIIPSYLVLFLIICNYHAYGASGGCDITNPDPNYPPNFCHMDVPTLNVDFTGNPDSLWCAPDTIIRNCQCCGVPGNLDCFQFFVTMDPGAEWVTLKCKYPFCPPGMEIYVECTQPSYTWIPGGADICLNTKGVGPYQISACKQGVDTAGFCIQSHPKQNIFVEPDVFFYCDTTGMDSWQVPFTFDTLTNFTLTFGDPYACISDTFVVDTSSAWPDSLNICNAVITGPLWYPGDTIWHTYDSAGIYWVTILHYLTPFCENWEGFRVITAKEGSAAFYENDYTYDVVGCHPYTVYFSNISCGVVSYLWNFGDGDTSTVENPVHTFTNLSAIPDTVYAVTLIVTDSSGNQDSTTHYVTVFPKPIAGFIADTISDSFPLTVTFFNTSAGANSFIWDFGDGDTSSQQNPVHTYDSATTYYVCLIAINSCGSDTICDTVSVICPNPVSMFGYTDLLLTVNFSDSSTGAANWLWDFGDGDTSTLQNPIHTYDSSGIYNVCLTVTNLCGSDTICDPVTVVCPNPVALFGYTDSLMTVNFSDSSTGAANWLWDFGDGIGTSTAKDTTYTYASAGAYWVTLTVTNPCGSDTTTRLVAVDVLGINEIWLSYKIKLYPNPNTGNMQLDYEFQEGQEGELIIFDIMGRKLFTYPLVNGNTINISEGSLKNGLYFYKIIINDVIVKTDKLIILK
ncbi:MAG: PKD domain-containing protein [Cytophagales bacterium]|nr:PKD domain-containing protein [Cytophagales bacterium]